MSTLDSLISSLEVDFVRLVECLVSPGWRLSLMASDRAGMHYNLTGHGTLIVDDCPPIALSPHTLVIVPPQRRFRVEVESEEKSALRTVESHWYKIEPGKLRRLVAGDREPQLIMICGYFGACYGTSIDLFALLPAPIVEYFDAADQIDQKLKSAVNELVTQEVGSGAMTAALMKQVLVSVLRRSLRSEELWTERFSVLSDQQIARAFSQMISHPGALHTVETLSLEAGLSRSAFMLRFTQVFKAPPMTVLRHVRMRQAQTLLATNTLSIDQIAKAVGYSSRSGFFRAFRKVHGYDPPDSGDAS